MSDGKNYGTFSETIVNQDLNRSYGIKKYMKNAQFKSIESERIHLLKKGKERLMLTPSPVLPVQTL